MKIDLTRWLSQFRSKTDRISTDWLSHFRPKPDKISTEDEQMYSSLWAVEELKNKMYVEPIRSTNLFTISAYDFDPKAAAKIANVVSRSYVIYDLEQQMAELQLKFGEKHPTVVQLKDNIDRMTKNLTGAELATNIDAIGPASVKIIEQAKVPCVSIGDQQTKSLVSCHFFERIFRSDACLWI